MTRLTRSALDEELVLGHGDEVCVLESATVYALDLVPWTKETRFSERLDG